MEKQTIQILKTILVSIITLIIFCLIFTKIDIHEVIKILSHADPLYLLISLLILFAPIIVTIKRWHTILKVMGYAIQLRTCLNVLMAALPLASITPSKSGDIVRAYYLKEKIPISKTIGSVLTERVFDIFKLVLFSLIGMVFCQKYEMAFIALITLLCIVILFFIEHTDFHLTIRESWNVKLQNMGLSMKTLTRDKKAFSIIMFYTLLIWFLAIIQTLIFFYALGISIPVIFAMASIPIAIFIGLVPVTLGGMGTRDAAIIFLFSQYAAPSQLLGVGILFSVFRYWLPSLLGIPFMRKMMKHDNIK